MPAIAHSKPVTCMHLAPIDIGTGPPAPVASHVRRPTEFALDAVLDAVPARVLLLDAEAFITFRNAPAVDGDLACLAMVGGRVVRFAGAASEPFERAFARARAGVGSSAIVVRTDGGRPQLWRVTLGAVATRDRTMRAVVLLVEPPAAPACAVTPALRRLFGLTAAEARVLELLLDERAPREIAAELQIAMSTVRSHLSALFAKTCTQRQTQLLALARAAS